MERYDKIQIPVPSEFSFDQNMKYLIDAGNECMYEVEDSHIRRALSIPGEAPVFIDISDAGADGLLVQIWGAADDATLQKVQHYVTDWFDLETDLRPFYAMAQEDRYLSKAIEQFYGLRNMGIPDFFEAVSWGIIGQQINLAFAFTLKRRFVETFGSSIEWEGKRYWLFPTPETIAALSVEELVPLQMTQRKSEYLIGVARLIVEGTLSKEVVQAAGSYKEAEKMLTSVRGIGPWTANYVLMRCLRSPNAFPLADVGLLNAIKYLDNLDEKPSREELLRLAVPWADWESYATFYLWRFLY
ncbi:DNA-3-methyladenine glycosylase family protein [Sporosarcina cyprini]|uniref:DNA-3-methyladenine glycosylase family protein n=1 Tax=Sporosarcina cyprini TaxID=2910523 RepID=UPI002342F218|nr:DNA-3-methyladenine glycosylase [Sporosarcina cyprini]